MWIGLGLELIPVTRTGVILELKGGTITIYYRNLNTYL